MAALLFPELQFSDASGSPLASGKVYTYVAGTTTPLATYTDSGGLTSVGSYVDLDSNGRPNNGNGIWLGTTSNYKMIIKNSAGSTIQTIDNVSSGGFNGSSSFVTAVAEAGLTSSRTLTTSTSNTVVDAGAGSTIQVQRAALTGDVTASANSNATTIANDAVTTVKILNSNVTTAKIADANVTLAKLADMATDCLLGRDTAGSGVPEVISLGSSLSFSGSGSIQRAALTGDVTASANSNATTIANDAVTTVKILNSNVTTAKIADANVTLAKLANLATSTVIGKSTTGTGVPEAVSLTGGLQMDGSTSMYTSHVSNSQTGTTYTAVASDRGKLIRFTTQATATLSLTAAATLGDGWYTDVLNANSGVLVVNPNSTETINGATTLLVQPGSGIRIYCNGSTFFGYTLLLPDSNGALSTTPAIVATSLSSNSYTYSPQFPCLQSDPAQITSSQNNYIFGGQVNILTANGAYNITGLSLSNAYVTLEATQSIIIYLVNSSAFTLTLKHQDAASSATYRFKFSTGADIALAADQTIALLYDNTADRWRNIPV